MGVCATPLRITTSAACDPSYSGNLGDHPKRKAKVMESRAGVGCPLGSTGRTGTASCGVEAVQLRNR